MVSNGRHGGVESMLGSLLETSEANGVTKPLPPKDMHRTILHTLVAHGLHASAQCLRSEADLGDLPAEAPSLPARPNRLARSHDQAGPPGVHLANHERVRAERAKVASCFEVVAEQRQRLDELRSTVQQLREARGGASALARVTSAPELRTRRVEQLKVDIEQLKSIEEESRAELRAKAQEVIVLKQLLSTKMSAEVGLLEKVRMAKEEVSRLRSEKES